VKAARELNISRCYLHRLLNQLNINDVPKEDEADEGEIPPEEGASPSGGNERVKIGSDVA
jgi:hypothetical protein